MFSTLRDIANVIDDLADGSITHVRIREESYTGFGRRSINDWIAEMTRRSPAVRRAVMGVGVLPYGTTTRSMRQSSVVARAESGAIPATRVIKRIATNMRNGEVRIHRNLGMQMSHIGSDSHVACT